MELSVHTNERLKELQSLPLDRKIGVTIARLTEFVNQFGEDGCYVSVSGGKDSAVLWDITHKVFPNIPAVFSDTGLEYPEVRDYAKSIATEVVKPKLSFLEVIREYGYPLFSKEISEAIYYARRNTPPLGQQTIWKRLELLGQRPRGSRRQERERERLETHGTSRHSTSDVTSGVATTERRCHRQDNNPKAR